MPTDKKKTQGLFKARAEQVAAAKALTKHTNKKQKEKTQTVTKTVLRNGKKQQITVKVKVQPKVKLPPRSPRLPPMTVQRHLIELSNGPLPSMINNEKRPRGEAITFKETEKKPIDFDGPPAYRLGIWSPRAYRPGRVSYLQKEKDVFLSIRRNQARYLEKHPAEAAWLYPDFKDKKFDVEDPPPPPPPKHWPDPIGYRIPDRPSRENRYAEVRNPVVLLRETVRPRPWEVREAQILGASRPGGTKGTRQTGRDQTRDKSRSRAASDLSSQASDKTDAKSRDKHRSRGAGDPSRKKPKEVAPPSLTKVPEEGESRRAPRGMEKRKVDRPSAPR